MTAHHSSRPVLPQRPVHHEKPAVRALALALRDKIESGVAAQIAERLADLGPTLAREQGAKVVAAYWSIGAEIVTLPLLEALDAAGFTVVLPVTGKRGEPLLFRRWQTGDKLVPGPMNIPEPAASAPVFEPDLLFVPLAAFDRKGRRIGYGAGFYDATLRDLRARKKIVAIGAGYSVQEVAAVPYDIHDERLDLILTERELIVAPAAA